MAFNARPNHITNNIENLHARQTGKEALQPIKITKRPALGELSSNTLQNVQINRSKPLKPLVNSNVVQGKPVKETIVKPEAPNAVRLLKKDESRKCNQLAKDQIKSIKDVPVKVLEKTAKVVKEIPYSSRGLGIVDPDAADTDDPQLVTEYLGDIFAYLRSLEDQFEIKENFLDNSLMTPSMRRILVNWLVDVHQNFSFVLETLYLCISITDRYLQINKSVGRKTLQLVGVGAMLIACKYEEMYMPEISDFVYICDNAFSATQILQMEKDILIRLDFMLGKPLPITFLRRCSKVAQVAHAQHTLAKYLLELSLTEADMSHWKPSILAAAASCLSSAILDDEPTAQRAWTPTMAHYTTYKYEDISPAIRALAATLVKAKSYKQDAVVQKYASSKFFKISLSPKLNNSLVKRLTVNVVVPVRK